MFRSSFPSALCLAVVLLPSLAQAHISLDYPPPRVANSGGGPCGTGQGSETFSANPVAFEPGAQITIAWHDTIPHAGAVYRIVLAGSDAALAEPNGTIGGGLILAENIPMEADAEYTADVTLPSEVCEACTIQVVQSSSASYYQCADITIGVDQEDQDTDSAPTNELNSGCATFPRPNPGMPTLWWMSLLGLAAISRRRVRSSSISTDRRTPLTEERLTIEC